MNRITRLLALFGGMCCLTGARADTVTQFLNFQATNQSLWGPGVTSLVSPSFDMTGSWNAYSFDKSAGTRLDGLGHFSAGATGGVDAGRAGLVANAYANGGTVNIAYPITLTLNYPNPSTLSPGQTFTISSSWSPGTPKATPALTTTSPKFGAKFGGVMEVADAHLKISGRAFGEWVFRKTIFSESIHFHQTLLDTKDLSAATKDFAGGLLTVAYKPAKIDLTGTRSGNNLFAYGSAQNADRSGFVSLTGNFSNAIGYVAMTSGSPKPLKFSDSIDYFSRGCGFKGAYDILSLIGTIGVDLEESVAFKPTPIVSLTIVDRVGSHVITFPAGKSVRITMPTDGSGLYIRPTVSLDNTFTSIVSANASAGINFYPFDISCTLGLPGYTLPSLNYFVPASTLVSRTTPFTDMYNNTFKLGGFDDQYLPEIYFSTPPPPTPIPLVAKDHFYDATLQSDSTGTYYYLTVAPINGLISDAEGPASLKAVAQDWTPDPTNPNLYFRLTAAGAIEFKYPPNVSGEFQTAYQITDGNGHFATAHVYIHLYFAP